MKKSNLIIGLVTIVIICFPVCYYTNVHGDNNQTPSTRPSQIPGQYTPEQIEKIEKLVKQRAAEDNGRFLLKGVVVDEKGRSLKDVQITVDRGVAKMLVGVQDTPPEKHVVNGTFAFDIDNAAVVRLEVDKQGYYRYITDYVLPKDIRNEYGDEVLSNVVDGDLNQAALAWTPSVKITPAMTASSRA